MMLFFIAICKLQLVVEVTREEAQKFLCIILTHVAKLWVLQSHQLPDGVNGITLCDGFAIPNGGMR